MAQAYNPLAIQPEGKPLADAPKQKLAIIVKSDAYEDLVLALSFAGIGVNSGIDVSMFFTSRASRVLRKGGFEEAESKPLDDIGEQYRERCSNMGFTNLAEVMGQLKEKGGLRVYICTRGMRAFEIRQDELISECDGVMGTATFLIQEVMTANASLTF